MVFYGPGRAHSTGIDPLKALLKVIPACTGWSAIQTWKQKEDEPMADLKAHLEALFLWYSVFPTCSSCTTSKWIIS